ncbi:carboxy terminal-processing peptidase [Oceanospirillum linum]|uniref:carboxy terminal-processing peptidase n=1 Tax=Oceanospirillum linum TaxID=966 RepID=UPI00089EA392|nr:carboxy terminal-processing peptidase [Oceanospirillum linum]SEG33487.1 C-terminal processing peptidase-1. Serine peptidase. MEROPS family S41A [Oleiphilus messinensis]SMP29339.1 C-terminal processing peptidase-1. Serine peptidase. MEROPS family S41A [Oceanospirillum linum]
MITTVTRRLLALFLASSLTIGTALAEVPDAIGTLAPTESQQKAAQDIVERLNYGHYREVELNDQLSKEIYLHFLEELDGNKAYFTQAEINRFNKYQHLLDDGLKEGDLTAAFEIYNLYQQKVESRIQSQLRLLDTFSDDYAFKRHDALMIDRKDFAWAADEKELDQLWDKRLENSLLSLKLSGKDLADAKKTLKRRLENQLKRITQTRSEDVFQIYMNAYTQLYDPHTQYQSPRSSETFNIRMKLSLEGIGALLQTEDEFTKVVSLVPGGPVAKAGELKPADKIIGVGQDDENIVDVVGWRLDEVVDLIRGPKASTVRLQVIPANATDNSQTQIISIVRNTVKLEDQAAKKSIVTLNENGEDKKIGIIDIPAFYVDFDAWRQGKEDYRSTTRDVLRLINELQSEDIDGLVIDLRNNGGGALQEANSLVGLFIERGATVQVRNAEGRIDILGDPDKSIAYTGPLAVLVNRLSASASEIFAGAIQDYQRGLIIGSQTFGKGTVQSVTPLDHGQLKLTRAKFYRISGESTQHMGVVPDIQYPSLVDTEQVGESALEFALPWDKVQAVRHKEYSPLSLWLPELKERHQTRAEQDPDLMYLAAQQALFEQMRSVKQISLNEQARKAESERIEAQQLALENERRTAKGLQPLEKLSDIPDKEEDPNQDAELVESGRILLDMIDLANTAMADVD